MVLTTAADVKAAAKRRYINPDTTRWTDLVLTAAIADAQKQIEDETGLIFDEQSFTENFSGYEVKGGYTLLLENYPITEISTLTIDGTAITENTGFYVTDSDIGKICFESELPTTGYNNIVVTGKYGMETPHPTAKALCEDIVVWCILANRETPPHLKDILRSSSSTNNLTLKADTNELLVPLVFDIENRLKNLPHKGFATMIPG